VNKLQKEVIAPKKEAKEPCEEEVKEMKSIQADIKRLRVLRLNSTSLLVFGVICSTGKPVYFYIFSMLGCESSFMYRKCHSVDRYTPPGEKLH
jgi:hypothetical protein